MAVEESKHAPAIPASRDPIQFFELCARQQDPDESGDQETRGICNNSDSKYIADELTWWDDWQQMRQRYLRAKFAYLASLQLEQPLGTAAIAQRLGVDSGEDQTREILERIEEIWHRTATAETRALLLRMEQLPDEVVVAEWYYVSAELDEWAAASLQAQQAAAHQAWRDVQGSYTELQRSGPAEVRIRSGEVQGHERQLVASLLHSGTAELLAAVNAHLLGVGDLPANVEMDLRPEGDVLLRLAPNSQASPSATAPGSLTAEVATALFGTGSLEVDPDQLIERFTVAVAQAVDCALCDFLVWDDVLLRPRASSDPTTDLSRLTEVPYGRAEGISGSVVVVPRDAPRRWVGTNDFPNDPRASDRHADVFQEGVGELTDYWLHPVFDGSRLFGAIRVINRNRARYVAGVPWTEGVQRELQDLAVWFEGAVLPRVDEAARSRSRQPVRHRSDPAHAGAIQRLRSECQLDWIDPDFLSGLIKHMCSVAFRKVEKTSLGCCIGVFDERDIKVMVDRLNLYKAVEQSEIGDLDDAGALYSRVSPTAGMFLFDESGTGHGVVNLHNRMLERTGIDSAKALTRDREPSVILFLERGQDCVRVITGGQVAADYYLSDATGNWTPRIYNALVTQVVAAAPPGFEENNVEKVFRLATDLSYKRIGSMIILSEAIPDNVRISGGEERKSLYLDNLSKDVEFADLARIDGAMQIDSGGAIVRCGAIVRPNMAMDEIPDTFGAAGSRHRAAEDFSRIAGNAALVMVVSENRPLTVLSNGKKVLDGV